MGKTTKKIEFKSKFDEITPKELVRMCVELVEDSELKLIRAKTHSAKRHISYNIRFFGSIAQHLNEQT